MALVEVGSRERRKILATLRNPEGAREALADPFFGIVHRAVEVASDDGRTLEVMDLTDELEKLRRAHCAVRFGRDLR